MLQIKIRNITLQSNPNTSTTRITTKPTSSIYNPITTFTIITFINQRNNHIHTLTNHLIILTIIILQITHFRHYRTRHNQIPINTMHRTRNLTHKRRNHTTIILISITIIPQIIQMNTTNTLNLSITHSLINLQTINITRTLPTTFILKHLHPNMNTNT